MGAATLAAPRQEWGALASGPSAEGSESVVSRPHVPVLLDAVLDCAAVRPGEVWVDCTLGFGGHAQALLAAGAQLIAFDRDGDARADATQFLAPHADQLTVIPRDFRELAPALAAQGVTQVDGVLADLGVSSWQLDQPARGFSFKAAGPVDMRMDPTHGEPARALIERLEVPALADVIRRYGEEAYAGPVARGIKAWAAGAGPHDTQTLAQAVVRALPRKEAARRRVHPATKTFQGLRIAVNDELGALEALLAALPGVLAPGGRGLIISFHSLEDRLVKQAFAEWSGRRGGDPAPLRGMPQAPVVAPFELITRKPRVADAAEAEANPRARSARLRAVRKRRAA